MEPEENLEYDRPEFLQRQLPIWYTDTMNREGAKDILEEYFRKQGGRPEKPKPVKAGAKKRKSLPVEKKEKDVPKKRSKRTTVSEEDTQTNNSHNWIPKGKSWESDVDSVETILRDKDGGLYSYLNWRNGKKSKISIETCYEKCPQKVRALSNRPDSP
jgi:chromobox protein 1